MEGALQLSHENVHEAVFGQMPRFFGILIIDHHFLLPPQLHLCEDAATRRREQLSCNVQLQKGSKRHQVLPLKLLEFAIGIHFESFL